MATTKAKTCEENVREKSGLVRATSIIPDEAFEQLLAHMMLYCKLEMSLKETWSDGMSLFGIKSYKDNRYPEFKRIFNLLKKIISNECECWKTENEKKDDSKNEWKTNSEW